MTHPEPWRAQPLPDDEAPTTDCAFCGRTAKECNDSHAKGWDGCCMGCDGAGRIVAHHLRITPVGGRAKDIGLSRPCANGVQGREVPAVPPEVPAVPPAGPTLTDDEQADLRIAFDTGWLTLLAHVTDLCDAYRARGYVMGDLAHDETLRAQAEAEEQ